MAKLFALMVLVFIAINTMFAQSPSSIDQIVYVGTLGESVYQIFVMNMESGVVRQLTNTDTGLYPYAPDCSPDGKQIAFTSSSSSFNQGALTLRDTITILHLDDLSLTSLTKVADGLSSSQPAWSPDGEQIVFVEERVGRSSFRLYVINADKKHPVLLTELNGRIDYPSWSPDGSRIMFTLSTRFGSGEFNQDIYLIDVNSKVLTQLTHTQYHNEFSPAWSPNSARIAFASDENGNADLYTMNVDTSHRTRITSSKANEIQPDWSPDGSRITFVSYEANVSGYTIYVMDFNSGSVRRLTNPAQSSLSPCWLVTNSPHPGRALTR